MALSFFLPHLKKRSTKDHIIEILTEEKALTNQIIYNRLRKKYGISKSYQTIRQALVELTEVGVLEKKKKEYSISIQWIKTSEEFITFLRKKYIDKKEVKIINKDTKELTLKSLYELGHFVLYGFKEHFFDMEQENDLYMFVHHLWFPFLDKNKRDLLKNFFSKNKNTIYVKNSYFLDKILAMFYRKYGKVTLNVKFDEFFDIIIQGNCIAKIYLPKELRERMDKLYRFRSLNFTVIDELSDMTFANYQIRILITRDKEMVQEIKEKLKQ